LSRNVTIDDEVNNRIAKASAAFGRLKHQVWERRGIRTETKLKVYRAVVLTTLPYACETWTVYSQHALQLNRFHLSCLRRILRVRWQDKIPDTEILERTNLPSIQTLLKKAQLRWARHIQRMPDHRIPKQLLYGELCEGKRSRGWPKLRYKDTLKATLKSFNINTEQWEDMACERATWRSLLTSGAAAHEKHRTAEAAEKRKQRKQRDAEVLPANYLCDVCGRHFRARIGLISHTRTHRK